MFVRYIILSIPDTAAGLACLGVCYKC
jgi:hypothetical protein